MSRTVFESKSYTVTYTCEAEGPHLTKSYDHYENTYVICALFRGHGAYYIEGNYYPASSGDIMLIRPDELRCCRYEQYGPHERLALYLKPAVLSPLWDYEPPLMHIFQEHPPGIGNKLSLPDESKEIVWAILEDIRKLIAQFSGDYDAMQEAQIHLLILHLLMQLYTCEKESGISCALNGDPAIRSVCQYIHENLEKRLTYQHLQEHCHVSRYQLSKLFLNDTGMTLTEYITQKRLIKVSELVRNGERLESAAIQAGFHNYSHFYKAFIKYKRCSPKEYFSPK